jgi:hypothetical protein
LRSGAICFVAPVGGKVTGAVFVGDGNLVLDPGLPSEAASLKMLTRESEFSENSARPSSVLPTRLMTRSRKREAPPQGPVMPAYSTTAKVRCVTTRF